MSEASRFFDWPAAEGWAIAAVIGVGCATLGVAVLVELNRRRRDAQLRIQAEWRAIRDLCHEREVHDEDFNLLKAIITNYSSANPYKAVTRRLEFDACMERYFVTLQATENEVGVAHRGAQLRDVRSRLGLDYVPLGQRIHSTRELSAGQTLWASRISGEEPRWFHVRTTEVDEAYFHLAPVGSDAIPPFKTGDRIKFRLWREEDARYIFEAPVLKSTEKPISWQVGHVVTLIRNQARAHFRIRFEQTVPVNILNAALNDDHTNLESRPPITQMHGRITSLSGGGLAVVFQQPMPKQVLLRIPFTLPGTDRHIVAFVRPAGTQPLGTGSLVRGRFVAMDDETRDEITRYVFVKQKQNASDEKRPR